MMEKKMSERENDFYLYLGLQIKIISKMKNKLNKTFQI